MKLPGQEEKSSPGRFPSLWQAGLQLWAELYSLHGNRSIAALPQEGTQSTCGDAPECLLQTPHGLRGFLGTTPPLKASKPCKFAIYLCNTPLFAIMMEEIFESLTLPLRATTL